MMQLKEFTSNSPQVTPRMRRGEHVATLTPVNNRKGYVYTYVCVCVCIFIKFVLRGARVGSPMGVA